MKTFLLAICGLVLSCPAVGQNFGPQPMKVGVNYTATTSRGFKFQWNSNHNSNKLNDPLDYKYRTDYSVGLNKSSKLSLFTEGVGKQNSLIGALDLSYNKNRSLGINYGYTNSNFAVNLQYTQNKTILSGLTAQSQDRALRLDIKTQF